MTVGAEALEGAAAGAEAKHERPLVTFALFAYNQEKYIREAVEGAFSQTYEPLEIILSDDCSTDRTFEIMQEMAAVYRGSHRVVVRRNIENYGVLRHVRAVAEEANGQFFVLAAGDDVSKPTRVIQLIKLFANGADAVCSNYDIIDEFGSVASENLPPLGDARSRLPWLKSIISQNFIYGATSSYRTSIVRQLPHTLRKVMSEDTPLNLILQLYMYKSMHVSQSLVQYRQHKDSISTSVLPHRNIYELISYDLLDQERSLVNLELLNYINDCITIDSKFADLIYIKREINFYYIKYNWRKYTISKRLETLFRYRDLRTIRWCSGRLFGPLPIAIFKFVVFPIMRRPRRLK